MSLAAILLLTAACTDELNDCPTDTGRVIAFTPSAESRAAVDGSALPSGSSFSVWGWYGTEGDITKQVFKNEHETVSESNGKWTYTGGVQYWIPGNTYNFYGVYPAELPNVDVTNNGNITVTNFNCSATGTDAVDLMTASRTEMKGNNPETVAMKFNHELAKVNIIVTSEGDAVNIKNAKVYGISHIGTLNNKQWAVGNSSTEDNPSFSGSLNISEEDIQPHELFGGSLLLIPTSAEKLANAILSFDYQYKDGTSESAKINLKRDPIQEWLAGSQYKYTITIPRSTEELKLEVTVLPWTKEDNTSVEW